MLVTNWKKRLKEKSTKKGRRTHQKKGKKKKVVSCVQDLYRLVYQSVSGISMGKVENTNVCFSRCR